MSTSILIFGDGHLGRAVAAAARSRGDPADLVGRPSSDRHRPVRFAGADVVVEASRGEAVRRNIQAVLDGGIRRLVIATTDWAADRTAVETHVRDAGATAVASANFSFGVALFGRLVDQAAALFGSAGGFDPYLLEWHRRTKVDRPSGTALDLAGRIATHDPRLASASDVETTSIRAGASPGMHLVGFDAAGETVELRLTARDRSAYAAGVLATVDWLMGQGRPAGVLPFDVVVDELLAGAVDAA
jgi:4-hydroxy-tetrahydrodipicolinate reductase